MIRKPKNAKTLFFKVVKRKKDKSIPESMTVSKVVPASYIQLYTYTEEIVEVVVATNQSLTDEQIDEFFAMELKRSHQAYSVIKLELSPQLK